MPSLVSRHAIGLAHGVVTESAIEPQLGIESIIRGHRSVGEASASAAGAYQLLATDRQSRAYAPAAGLASRLFGIGLFFSDDDDAMLEWMPMSWHFVA
jgi:hypothetical protein